MGLTIAYRLAQANYSVTVLEGDAQLGGLSTWFDYGEFTWDKFYHVILRSDKHLLQLIEELSLSEQMVWTPTKTGFLWHETLISMSNYWEFIRFPALNIVQKARLAMGIIYCQKWVNTEAIAGMKAPGWLKKVFGKKVYECIWEPLLKSKFGSLKEEVPASLIQSVIQRYSSTRSTKDGREWMGHLKGSSLKLFINTLAEKIQNKGGQLICAHKVTRIEQDSEGKSIVYSENNQYPCDRVINTLPLFLLQKIAPDLEGIYLEGPKPKYLGVIRLALVLKWSISPYYVMNIIDRGYPFTGIIEVSSLIQKDEMAGYKLVMIPRYDIPQSEWFHKPDEEIKAQFIQHLKNTWPDIEENIVHSYVHRAPIVQAVWTTPKPTFASVPKTTDGLLWSVSAELSLQETLNNNAIVHVANQAIEEFMTLNPI